MALDLTFVVVGLTVLIAGAWLTVRSASSLAASFGLSRVLIGATVVAFGTSAPEFVVSLVAGLQGSSGVAVGNILGSNVANTALVLGIAAVINPLNVNRRLIRWEIPVLFVATAAMLLAGASGAISAIEGGMMFLGLIAFVVLSPFLFPETGAEAAEGAGEAAGDGAGRSGRALAIDGALLVAGGREAGVTMHGGGAMVVIEGPAFSTRAESALYRSWDAAIIGMTALPEAKLAREAELCYASICFVTDSSPE